MRFKCSLYSRPLKKNGRPNPNTCKQLWLKTELYLTVYVKFVFFLFVCMYGFNFLNSEKYWKMSLFCFQNADLLLLYLTHSFLCYSLLNMFVTVAVINVKLLAVWGYVAFLHVSTLCAAVSYTLYGHEYEWNWDQVSGLNHHSCCVRVCVWMWG